MKLVLAPTPTVIEGHAFTTGQIQRAGIERVLPNTMVEFAMKDGVGCDMGHFSAAELQGKIIPDQHVHEHATCFNVKGRGLVVISSCGHVGIVNSVRQAQEVSGVRKVHAIVGGFHLGPAPADYLDQVAAEISKLEPDAVIPMHCSGDNFVTRCASRCRTSSCSQPSGAVSLRRMSAVARLAHRRRCIGERGRAGARPASA